MASSPESEDFPQSPLDSPSPPTSPEETTSFAAPTSPPTIPQPTPLSPRSVSFNGPVPTTSNMTASSTPLGALNAARRPPGAVPARAPPTAMNPDIAAKMKAFSLSRQNTPVAGQSLRPGQLPKGLGTPGPSPITGGEGASTPAVPSGGPPVTGFPAGFKLPPQLNRPTPHMANSSPALAPGARAPGGGGMSLAQKRGMQLPGGLPGSAAAPGAPPGRQKPKMTLSQMGGGPTNATPGANGSTPNAPAPSKQQSQMEKYAEFVDTKNGALLFKGKARVHGGGIEFTSGKTFHISLDEVDTLDELGKGNYGTVYKVRHARPRFRRQGLGLAGNKPLRTDKKDEEEDVLRKSTGEAPAVAGTTGIVMAMKEMRLELDDAKFQSIIMELDILHRCLSPYIVDFYGAFFQEGAVYICMEFMDGGSIDKIYGDGIPENVLRKITLATVLGLKCLKEEHNIIHRDVKPTNILVNTRGHVKICDFGVSGNLVASIAKTNIGCQSYMAPERISSGGMAQAGPGAGTYSVQSDIWSLGLSLIECALGRYPYPPETYDNIFSQLSAIVDGEPPDLPADKFSEAAHDFVAGCLNKIPKLRPTYPMLLQHAWLAPLIKPETIREEDEEEAEAEAAAAAGEDIPTGVAGQPAADAEFYDREVGEWVIEALDRRKRGVMGHSAKPALHAAPLDAVSSPGKVAVA